MSDSEPSVLLVVLLAVVRRDICGERGIGRNRSRLCEFDDGWAEACSGTPSPQVVFYLVDEATEISYTSLFTASPARLVLVTVYDVAEHVFRDITVL